MSSTGKLQQHRGGQPGGQTARSFSEPANMPRGTVATCRGVQVGVSKFATEMMRADAGFHADQARGNIGKAGLDLATRPFLTQHNRATLIVAYDVKRVLADIDTNHGNCSVQCLGHRLLLVLTPLPSFYRWRGGSTAGPSH